MQKLPNFKNEQEESEFWDTHDSTDFLAETEPVDVIFVDARPTKKQISLRLEPVVIDQIKVIANDKGIGYQTMIRLWVMERLRSENSVAHVN